MTETKAPSEDYGLATIVSAIIEDLPERYAVHPETVHAVLPELQKDLIVIKASGSLLEDYGFIAQMALLSRLGINYILICGGQDQLDDFVEYSDLSKREKALAGLKYKSERYTSDEFRPIANRISNDISDTTAEAIVNAGGNARAFHDSLFIGQPSSTEFKDPHSGEKLPPNNFAYIPLGYTVPMQPQETSILDYLSGKGDTEDSALGRGVVTGFSVAVQTHSGPSPNAYSIFSKRNGDADNVAIAVAAHFAEQPIIAEQHNGEVEFVRPKRVYLIELSQAGGLRTSAQHYKPVVDVVKNERDIQDFGIEGGMVEKVQNNVRLARMLGRRGIEYMIGITEVRGLLPILFNNQATNLDSYTPIGTFFHHNGIEGLREFYGSPFLREFHGFKPNTGRRYGR